MLKSCLSARRTFSAATAFARGTNACISRPIGPGRSGQALVGPAIIADTRSTASLVVKASAQTAGAVAGTPKIKDHTSLANFASVCVKHSKYELDVDFSKKVIEGYALVRWPYK
jgi:hypothetical protein